MGYSDNDADLLRFAWPVACGDGGAVFETQDGREVRVLYPGDEDSACGLRRNAEVEIDGVRRHGDVVFGVVDRRTCNPDYVVLRVVGETSDHAMDGYGRRIAQLVLPVPPRLAAAVDSLRRGAPDYECGLWLGDLDPVRRVSIMDELLMERMMRKCGDVDRVYAGCDGDWAQTLYVMLFRAMGGNRNREPYVELARRATYHMLLRERSSVEMVEALLTGTSGLLEGCYFDDYICRLQSDFGYLARKYSIEPLRPGMWQTGGVRAANRPLARIVQLASFLSGRDFIVGTVLECRTAADVYALFDTEVSGYWATHPVPDGSGDRCPVRIGREKAALLAINAVAPVMFAYGNATGRGGLKENALELLASLPAENNGIVRGWSGRGVPVGSALDSQAVIQLRNEYCAAGRCTDCKVGKSIIKSGGALPCKQ